MGDWEPRGLWGHKYTQSEPGEATRNGSVSETLVSASSKEHASWLETVRSSTGCACTFERYFVPSKNRVGELPFFLISLARSPDPSLFKAFYCWLVGYICSAPCSGETVPTPH